MKPNIYYHYLRWFLLFIALFAQVHSHAQVAYYDFVALQSLYNSTEGGTWTNQSGWSTVNDPSTTEVDVNSSWFGVVVSGGRVTELHLANNNLVGGIPAEFTQLEMLSVLELQNNSINFLPTFFGFNLYSLTVCNVASNNLTFSDLVPNRAKFTNPDWITPQATIVVSPQTYSVNAGATLDIPEVTPNSTNNTYKWFLNGAELLGINTNSFNKPNVTWTDAGSYLCQINNTYPELTSLTLNTVLIQVRIPFQCTISDSTNISCYGLSDGSATARPLGGVAPFQFQWKNAAGSVIGTDSVINNLLPDVYYHIKITDFYGNVGTDSVMLTQPNAPLLAEITDSTQVSCFGGSNGTATVSFSGGTAPYYFLWNDAENTTIPYASGLEANTWYRITVTDAHLCSASDSVFLTQPPQLIVNVIDSANVLCFGDSTGTATCEATGGIPPYSFLWNDIYATDSTSVQNLLASVFYTVTVTDSNGCVANDSVILSQPTRLLVNVTDSTNIKCINGNDGLAIATPSGGTAPYNYQWDNILNSTDSTATELFANVLYHVLVTDTNGCMARDSVMLSQPDSLLSSFTFTSNLLCYGDTNGVAIVTPRGGTQPYTYQWDTLAYSSIDSTAINLLADIYYHVTITDANGCTRIDSVSLWQPDPLSFMFTFISPVTCDGQTDGIVTVTPFGGTGPYYYLWDDTAETTDSTVINLIPLENYHIIVTDANGCTANDSIILQIPQVISIQTLVTDTILCFGQPTGGLELTPTGGTPPYHYEWTDNLGNILGGDAPHLTGMLGGTEYYVHIWDEIGCEGVFVVVVPQPPPIQLAISITNITCHDFDDGIIDIWGTGGTGTLHYVIGDSTNTDGYFWDLAGDTYHLTVYDSLNCVYHNDTLIVVNPPLLEIIGENHQDVELCYGDSTGVIGITAIGGTGIIEYSIDSGHVFFVNTGLFTYLPAGDYYNVVTDHNGCITRGSHIVIQQPTEVRIQYVQHENITTCFGDSIGLIRIVADGGTGSLQYSIYGGAQFQSEGLFVTLKAGNYYVAVKDNNNCMKVYPEVINISQPPQLLINFLEHNNLTCYGVSDGAITLAASGGTPSLHFSVSTYSDTITQTNGFFDSLPPARYFIRVTDSHNCQITYPQTVEVLVTKTVASFAVDTVVCTPARVTFYDRSYNADTLYWVFGNDSVSHQTNPTTLYINDTQQDFFVTSTLYVENQYGCSDTVSQDILVYHKMHVAFDVNPKVIYEADPTIYITNLSQNEFLYNYLWDFGDGQVPGNPKAHYYTDTFGIMNIWMTVYSGCSDTAYQTIKIIPAPRSDFSFPQGGCPPYTVNFVNKAMFADTFLWYFGDGTTSAEESPKHTYTKSGEYYVKLRSTGLGGVAMSRTDTVVVYDTPRMSIEVSPDTVIIGLQPIHCYNFTQNWKSVLWHFGDSTFSDEYSPIHFYDKQGLYTISFHVWSEDGCVDSMRADDVIRVMESGYVVFPSAFSPNPLKSNSGNNNYVYDDRTNDVFFPKYKDVKTYELRIYNRFGREIFRSNQITQGWDGYFTYRLCPMDVYVYYATGQYLNGQYFNVVGTVTLMR